MSADPAAVAGLTRVDPRSPGITRVRTSGEFSYLDASGVQVSDAETIQRIKALVIPPGWSSVWISPDPLGHIQATGVDSRGRTQYRYHQLWRAQRDEQKFAHMLRFADALPQLRMATLRDLRHRQLNRDRVAASAVRLIDLGLFRLGGERYAELDHHYGAVTLEKRHVSLRRDGLGFDYVAKEGKRRTITVNDPAVRPTVRALARNDNGLEALFCFQEGSQWRPLHSHDVSAYVANHAGGHFTAKEFRTWNATVLMALLLATADLPSSARAAKIVINASVRGVADWLGDTPAVARASYIDPRLITRYESDGRLAGIPALPARLPVGHEAESAVAALLAATASALDPPSKGELTDPLLGYAHHAQQQCLVAWSCRRTIQPQSRRESDDRRAGRTF
jgi:DNA topoisomerase I